MFRVSTATRQVAGSPDCDLSEVMDRTYRYERRIFDMTRWINLVGRDRAIALMAPRPDEHILEIGVGTARNLLKLHAREPRAHYYGADVSRLMLEVAQKKVSARGVPIALAQVPPHLASYRHVFRTQQAHDGFDQILLSFCLTQNRDAVAIERAALDSLKPGGRLFIVDFYDRRGWPSPLDRFLSRCEWAYNITFDGRVIDFLRTVPGDLQIESQFFRWSYVLRFVPASVTPHELDGARP
jgi:S-adenosylmethionine-diacylgycerolhomoserine-N-methlytransferase